jgi:hypothetical protein
MAVGYNPSIVSDGLVLYLDAANLRSYSGSGSTWLDLSGFGNTCSLINGPALIGTGSTSSISFDGSNDYATVYSIPTTFWTGGSWTVETFLFNNNPTSGDYAIVGTANQLHLLIRSGTAHLGLYNNDVASVVQISTTKWTHIAFQYDASNYNKLVYINGSLNNSSIGSAINVSGASTQIGKVSWGYNYFNGKIAYMKFYNRALTSQEILQNFNATRFRYGI